MVCSLGGGSMAVMARLLSSGSFSQSIEEEANHQKSTAQLICRELRDSDEPNLLDEEDMHVFGLKPMADPLDLVCCNACKKPIKASQYVIHAEICRTLNYSEETRLELNGSMGHRKPTKKERKKLPNANTYQASPSGELERSESVGAEHTTVWRSQLDVKIETNSPGFVEAKTSVDATCLMDGSGVSPGNAACSAFIMPPPAKRSKLITGEWLLLSDDLGTISGGSVIISTEDASRDSPKVSIFGGVMPNESVLRCKNPSQIHGFCLPKKDDTSTTSDFPVPLATKMYYSQRSNRLRSALCHLYYESVSSTKEICGDIVSTIPNGNIILSQASPQRDPSVKEIDDHINKRDHLLLPSVQKSDQIEAQGLEVCFNASEHCLPPGDSIKHFSVDNDPWPQVVPIGLTRNKYLSKSFSLARNSGQPLGTVQQQNGGVPVT